MPKQHGGQGILNLELLNKVLLAKWLWTFESENGMWHEILLSKYVEGKCISWIKHKCGDSHFWCSLLHVRMLETYIINMLKSGWGMEKTLGSGKTSGWVINP